MPYCLRHLATDQLTELPPGMHGIGREDDNLIALDDGSVSRHHARLIVGEGKVIVDDLGSSNGTALKGTLVKIPQLLEVNETVHFGSIAMRLEAMSTDPPPREDQSELKLNTTRQQRMRKPTDLIRLEQLSIHPDPPPQETGQKPPEPRPAQPPLSESGSLKKGTQSVRSAADIRAAHPHKLGSKAAGTEAPLPEEMLAPTMDLSKMNPKTPELKPTTAPMTEQANEARQKNIELKPASQPLPSPPEKPTLWPLMLVILLVGIIVGILIGMYVS